MSYLSDNVQANYIIQTGIRQGSAIKGYIVFAN